MKISDVNIIIDYKTLQLSENGFFMGKIYFQADDYIYPDANCFSNPLNIMRWLLREMRLLIESKAEITERYIYFSLEDPYHIYLCYLGNNLVALKFPKTINKISNDMIITAVSEDYNKEIHTITCNYSDLFKIAYNEGTKLFNMINVAEAPKNGEVLMLGVELEYSKRIINKIKRNEI